MNNRQSIFKPVFLRIFQNHMINTKSIFNKGLGLFVMASLLVSVIPSIAYAETVSVSIDGTSHDITYTGTNVSITGSDVDNDFVSLIFNVDVSDDGVLEITFPRDVFDSEYNGIDEDFIIVADGDEPNFTETGTTLTSRTLSISLDAGTEEIEIIGTVFGQPVAVIEEPDPVEPDPVEPDPVEPDPVEPDPVDLGPAVCTTQYDPVCGVDGKTYGNSCNLGVSGVDLDYVGECKVADPVEIVTCGEGTILQDGLCVLDKTCGEGTILVDGACEIIETDTEVPPPVSSSKGTKADFVYGAAGAFIIAFAVLIIMWLMYRASRSKN